LHLIAQATNGHKEDHVKKPSGFLQKFLRK
jgi:hypothetical protein